jgi:hypothetical protein
MNEISQELKSILSKSGFGECMDMFEYNDIFELVIPALLDNLNSRLESTLNQRFRMKKQPKITPCK